MSPIVRIQYPMRGSLRASFRPLPRICAIRSLWRHRESLSRWRVTYAHIQKALDQMNLQSSCIEQITGWSGCAFWSDPGRRDEYHRPHWRKSRAWRVRTSNSVPHAKVNLVSVQDRIQMRKPLIRDLAQYMMDWRSLVECLLDVCVCDSPSGSDLAVSPKRRIAQISGVGGSLHGADPRRGY